MGPEHVIKLLAIANNNLPALQIRCQELQRQAGSLKAGNLNAASTFQDLSNQYLISKRH
jgi:hypothetical protein